MKVCHLAPIPFGGHLPDFDEQCTQLARNGIEVHLVCTHSNRAAGEANLHVHELPLRDDALHLGRIRWTRRAAGIVRKLSPDVVHVYAYRGCGVLPLCERKAVWVFDLRTGAIADPLRAFIANSLSRMEALSYDIHVSIHEGLLRQIRSFGKRSCVVPLGADFGRYAPVNRMDPKRRSLRDFLGFNERDVVVVYLGALTPHRKPEKIIETAARLKDSANLKWLVIGYGSQLSVMRTMAFELGVDSSVKILDRVPYEEAHRYYQAADVGLAYVPKERKYEHQPPLKTIEMLASGLPLVASDTAGNRMFVQQGVNGLLCGVEPDEMARCILDIIEHLDDWSRRSLDFRRTMEKYSWEAIVRDILIPLYRSAVCRENGISVRPV